MVLRRPPHCHNASRSSSIGEEDWELWEAGGTHVPPVARREAPEMESKSAIVANNRMPFA